MEVIKKNIHMDRIKAQAVMQFAVEDDVNIPDSKPDVHMLNLEKGELVIDEIKPGADVVNLRGYLSYVLLYHTVESGSSLVSLQGRIAVDERMHMQGVSPSDYVRLETEVEDLTVSMIHSRKINIQSMITVSAYVDELYDEEIPVDLRGEEKVEYRRMILEPAQLCISKNDIFRIKEEITLTSNYPNIYQILWSTISLGDVEFKAVDNQLNLSGDVHAFILYEGEGEEHPVRSYEAILPFSGSLPCSGCREGMIPDVRYRLSQKEVAARPDFDGEERSIGLDLVMDCGIRVFEEDRMEMISDIYGVTREIETEGYPAKLKKLLARATGKAKVTDHVRVKAGNVLQLIHSEGVIHQEQQTILENGVMLQGTISIRIMYITGNDEAPYDCETGQIPYRYTLDIPGIAPSDTVTVHGELEHLQVMMLDSEEMDVKAVLSFSTVAFQEIPVSVISEMSVKPIDAEKLNNLPGMAIYTVKPGDNLWNIGKKYYTSVEDLRKLNALESDVIYPGQKLLIVKQG